LYYRAHPNHVYINIAQSTYNRDTSPVHTNQEAFEVEVSLQNVHIDSVDGTVLVLCPAVHIPWQRMSGGLT